MKRFFLLLLLTLLCLSGCSQSLSLPRANEPRNMALISVIGLSREETDAIQLHAATQGRADVPPLQYEAQGGSIATAQRETRTQGAYTASYAHVEHVLVEEASAQSCVEQALSFGFQNGEQSVEGKLWILRGVTMEELFAQETDLAGRLENLKTGGEAGTALPSRSLRQLAAQLADTKAAIIPALRMEGAGLVFDGYAIFVQGQPLEYVDGNLAAAMAILAGDSLHWTEHIVGTDGSQAALQLHADGSTVAPVMKNGMLTGLDIVCTVKSSPTELWESQQAEGAEARADAQLKAQLLRGVKRLQERGADPINLRRRAALTQPWQWQAIQNQWDSAFPELECNIIIKH